MVRNCLCRFCPAGVVGQFVKFSVMIQSVSMKSDDILVAINCLAYNHEPYIRDCLEGFVTQQTNFRFVAIVHDDASKDNTAGIIREYAERYPGTIIPIYETVNQFSRVDCQIFEKMTKASDETGAKYIALCEGDDYWTDKHKLQKQIDILEADSSLIGCVTDISVVDQYGNTTIPQRGGVVKADVEGRYNLRDFFESNHSYPTCTVVFRPAYKEELRKKYLHTANWYLGDWTLWMILHSYGDFYYINEPTAAYRINPTSTTHTCDRVGRAYANFYICNRVADVLPEEYSDIVAKLRDTRWVWGSVMHAYKTTGRYFGLIFASFMAAITCPKLLKKEFFKWLRQFGPRCRC